MRWLCVSGNEEVAQRVVRRKLKHVDGVENIDDTSSVASPHELSRQIVFEEVARSAGLQKALVVEADEETTAGRVVLTAVCAVKLLVPCREGLAHSTRVSNTLHCGHDEKLHCVQLVFRRLQTVPEMNFATVHIVDGEVLKLVTAMKLLTSRLIRSVQRRRLYGQCSG